jgi:hypothetical protein
MPGLLFNTRQTGMTLMSKQVTCLQPIVQKKTLVSVKTTCI